MARDRIKAFRKDTPDVYGRDWWAGAALLLFTIALLLFFNGL